MQTPSAAADIQAAVKKTLHSAAFSHFMAQAVQSAIDSSQPKRGEMQLAAQPTRLVHFRESSRYRVYSCMSADGTCEVSMQSEIVADDPRHRNLWYGSESRTDQQGRKWHRNIGYMVVDDFGFLVPVSA